MTRASRYLALAVLAAVFAPAIASAQPSVVGQWEGAVSWPLVASHAALLPDGRVLLWSDQTGATPRIWNPSTGLHATASVITGSLAGSSQTQLADGRILILGGRDATGDPLQSAGRFDVVGNTWTTSPFLQYARNEPTAIVIGDGRAVAISGEQQPGQPTDFVEYWIPTTFGWSTWDAQQALLRTPWAFGLSNREILVAGPEAQTRRLTADGESWFAVSSMQAGSRDAGTAVMVPGTTDRILAIGGRNPGVATCEILDLPTTTSWTSTGSMARARRHHQATLLADGSVLVTGGTALDDALDQTVLPAEVWRPETGTWTTLASMSVSRRRGSVALLLPDGRVLCAGGGDGTPGSEPHADGQIFSPPYLFKGARPTLTSAPTGVVFGSGFTMDSPQATDIERVWFVRAGAVSRGFDTSQRAVSLAFTVAPGRLTLTAPADSNIAPPGTYMAFAVDDAGVPSVARLIRLQRGVPTPVVPDITSTAPTEAVTGAPFTYIPSASGTTPMTWTLPSAPTWLSVSPTTGAIAGVPPTTGQFQIRLRATNLAGFDEQLWTLQVGAATSVRTVSPLGTTWRYFKGTTNPPATWATIAFNDATWLTGPSGFGFSDNDDATVLSDMQNNYTTVFTRHKFEVYNVNTVSKISILHEYDDGLAVFLNGTRILSRNAPATIINTSTATGSHEASANLLRQDFTDAATRALLVNGFNVVAAVGLNQSLSSSDVTHKVVLELTGGTPTPVDVGPELPDAAVAAIETVGPNPFASATHLRFRLGTAGTARLRIHDAAGRLVRMLESAPLQPGRHELTWDGRDARGSEVPAGVYLYSLEAPGLTHGGKLTRSR